MTSSQTEAARARDQVLMSIGSPAAERVENLCRAIAREEVAALRAEMGKSKEQHSWPAMAPVGVERTNTPPAPTPEPSEWPSLEAVEHNWYGYNGPHRVMPMGNLYANLTERHNSIVAGLEAKVYRYEGRAKMAHERANDLDREIKILEGDNAGLVARAEKAEAEAQTYREQCRYLADRRFIAATERDEVTPTKEPK